MKVRKFFISTVSTLLIISVFTSCWSPATAVTAVMVPAVAAGAVGIGIGSKLKKERAEEALNKARDAEKRKAQAEAQSQENAISSDNSNQTAYFDIENQTEVPVTPPTQNDNDAYYIYTEPEENQVYETDENTSTDSDFITISPSTIASSSNDSATNENQSFEENASNTVEYTTIEPVESTTPVQYETVENASLDLSLKELILAHHNEEAKEEILKLSNINQVDEENQTTLHYAAMANNAELVTFLLQNGANPEILNDNGETPIHTSIEYDAPDAALALVEGGANVFAENNDHRTAFSLGIEKSKNFYPAFVIQPVGEVRDIKGQTIVHYFIKTEDIDGIALCIERELALDIADNNGDTPLALAYENKSSAVSAALAAALILSEVTPIQGEFAYFENTVLTRNARQVFDDEQTGLHLAVLADHAGIAEYLIACDALLNAQDVAGAAPLHLAVRHGKTELVKILLEAGADVNACDSTLKTPLLITAPKDKQEEIYSLLLANDADASVQDLFGDNALHIATMGNMSTAIITKLINCGALVNTQNKKGITPIAQAVMQKNTDHMKLYVSYGADIFIEDANGNSPLTLCLKNGNLLKILVTNANINSTDYYGNTPLHIALEKKASQGSVRYLLDAGISVDALNCYGETPLFSALKSDNYNGLMQLIRAGAQKDIKDNQGNTALHTAVQWTAEKCLKKLLTEDYDVNAQNLAGKTPLAEAARQNRIAIMKQLIGKGANVNASDVTGKTILMDAIQCKNPVAATLLIKQGADANQKDIYGRNAFHEAASTGNIELIELIKATNVSPLSTDKHGKTPLAISFDFGTNVAEAVIKGETQLKDANGNSPIHIAINEHVDSEMIQMLINKGFNINELNNSDETALVNAIKLGSNEEASLLLQNGANIYLGKTNAILTSLRENPSVLIEMLNICGDQKDANGNSILHVVATEATADVLSVLIEYGANKTAQNNLGETAYDVAQKHNREKDVLEILR